MENETTCLTHTLGTRGGWLQNTTCRRDVTCLKVLGQQRLRQRLRQLVTILPRNHEVESGTKLRECQRPVAIHVTQLPADMTGTHFPSHYLRETYGCNHRGDKCNFEKGYFNTRQASLSFALDPNLHICLREGEAANFLILTCRFFLF